ncbi:MAG: ABC transporter permease [Cyclobacteriaceae bacterium]|nr:ABC transporter permease [Cyclobacteriaceae bacterium]
MRVSGTGRFFVDSIDMLNNYVKIAIRNLLKHLSFSLINVSGLAIAITCCLLIYLYIDNEISYDRYHQNSERIYRITRDFLSPDKSVNLHLGHLAPPFGPLLKNDFPEFEEVARTLQTRIPATYQQTAEQPVSFYIDQGYVAEPSLFNIFNINITQGNPLNNFDEPYKLIISGKTAERLFGAESPMGKRLKIYNTWDAEITGVFEDFPDESFWHPEMFISFATLNDPDIYGREGLERNWGNNSFGTFVLAREPFDPGQVASRFPDFLDKHMGRNMEGDDPMPSTWTRLYLQKLTDIHLHSHLDSEEEANGSITNVYMLGVIGSFILLIACFNFINLSTARASKRSREVGIRKVSGAQKYQLVLQFTIESVVIALFAMLVATGISVFALEWMNGFTQKSLEIFYPGNWTLYAGILLFSVLIGFLAGIYPAFVISAFNPVAMVKGSRGTVKGRGSLRKVLVAIQFALSIMLIIASTITFRQLNYLEKSDLGYDKDQVITLPYYTGLSGTYDAFYNELTAQSFIGEVSRSSRIPTGRLLDSQGSASVRKGDSLEQSSVTIKNIRCDYEFFDTYSIPVVAGRNFSKSFISDDSLAFILNETAVKMIGLANEEILGRDFQYGGVNGQVIGVVRDFHFESLREPIVPVVFKPSDNYSRLSIKISGNEMIRALGYIENAWRSFLPEYPFEYEFLSERYRNLYLTEQRQGQLFSIFAILAVLIASLGLFGLVTFSTLQRFKEIGIRKVLGASFGNILSLLSREVVVLVMIASLIAWPVTWYAMDLWLENFAYHVGIGFDIFLFSGLITLVIALLTISYQTVKAALANPVNSIRVE